MRFLVTLTTTPAVLRCAVLAAIGVIAVSSASAADIGSHLMAYYRLDGDAVDGSGRGHDGIVMGPTSTTDRFGAASRAMSFDGVDDMIEIADSPDFDFNQPLTVALWVNSSSSQTGGLVGQWGPGGEGGDAFQLYNDDVRLYAAFPESGLTTVNDPTPYANGTWRFIAVTCDGSTVRFFLDGVPGASASVAVDPVDSAQPVILGMERINWDSINHFAGAMDDVRIYNRVLSDNDIMDLANELFTDGFELGDSAVWSSATP
jgi:hypothetical protein